MVWVEAGVDVCHLVVVLCCVVLGCLVGWSSYDIHTCLDIMNYFVSILYPEN